MKISIIGSGYVGLTTGVGFALKGHEVLFVDIDDKKIEMINEGKPHIYEPGLEEHMKEVHKKGLIKATKDYKEIAKTNVSFIAVPTPTNHDGSMDLRFVEGVAKSLGEVLKNVKSHVVVVKSTVLPGTTENIVKEIVSGISQNTNISYAMNPEFLREGKAMYDVLNPDRVVIGVEDEKAKDILVNIYRDFVDENKILVMPIRSAELVKYASNAFLSMKISYANLVGRLAKRLGVDVYEVMDAVGMDKRIGRDFLNAGLGFGGSCFPKDVKALERFTNSMGVDESLFKDILSINDTQIDEMIEIIKDTLGNIEGRDFVVLGLSFKPETDDVRESRALKLIERLIKEGANKIYAHDPVAIENAKRVLRHNNVVYVKDLGEVVNKAENIIIATEWDVYRDENLYKNKIVFDGRRVVKGEKAKHYEGLAW